ncbi:MAG TPA: flagellar hook-basal body protein [Verrucomicrobiae bacterium]|nr:flagellar hook-basal body protein [Verrucomicrobiae bacterium]
MEVSLYSAASAMNATEQWQDLIADNLSSASVPGARQREAVFSGVPAGQSGLGDKFVIPSASSVINFHQGELLATGNNMDFAVEGPGFITVQMPDGSKAYTRDGEFKLNSQGQLITKSGYTVMGSAGPLQFDPNNTAPITVTADGQVSQGADVKGKLGIVEFSSAKSLTMLGGGLFRNDVPNMLPETATETSVRQGFIEQGNTSPTLAMASMITAMRMFESNEKVMSMQSDRMSKSITDLSGTT